MAGGGGVPEVSSGGKKTVDFQLNLIPMIDLLSVLISFLLMTAVWTQVSRIDVKQQPTQTDGPPLTTEQEALNLTVLIKASGYTVTKQGVLVKELEKKGDTYDHDGLSQLLERAAAEHPDNHRVIVTSEDHIPYQELIVVMDLCLQHRLDGISVAGVDT